MPQVSFLDWIRDYFSKLPGELDADVLSEYVSGVLEECDSSETDLHLEVENLLSVYLPDAVRQTAVPAIVNAFVTHRDSKNHGEAIANENQVNVDSLNIEDRMRAMLRVDCARIKTEPTECIPKRRERDACTTAWLRQAGVAGYQGDSEDEKNVEIAITNAQFRAKQRLDAFSGHDVVEDGLSELSPTESPDSEIDLEQLEDISGYGKKTFDVKPGTVEDALSVLNPSLFGTACSVAARPFLTGVSRLPTPGPRANPNLGFQLPASVSSGGQTVRPENPEDTEFAKNRRNERKKKTPMPSKHMAKVASQMEAKMGQNKIMTDSNSKIDGSTSVRGLARVMQGEMDAFLFSDSESNDEESLTPLPEGGRNRERVKAAEQAARQTAAAAAAQRKAEEKASREKQLKEAAERKQAAQKKAQKVERRR